MSEKSWRNTTYAFPFDDGEAVCTGMTLRDYFAGQVMQGLCADPSSNSMFKDHLHAAKTSYQIADAMLEARK